MHARERTRQTWYRVAYLAGCLKSAATYAARAEGEQRATYERLVDTYRAELDEALAADDGAADGVAA